MNQGDIIKVVFIKEILIELSSFLTAEEITKNRLVCSSYDECYRSRFLWQMVVKRRYGYEFKENVGLEKVLKKFHFFRVYDGSDIKNFDEIGLKESILRGIASYGFEKPTMLQSRVIVQFCRFKPKRDMHIQAKTGSGSSAAVFISMLQSLEKTIAQEKKGKERIRGLVICPTRELAIGCHSIIKTLGKFMGNLKTCCLFGGSRILQNIVALKKGVNIVVGTPGRTIDIIQRIRNGDINLGDIEFNEIEIFCCLEFDRMFDMGFKHQIDKLFDVAKKSKARIMLGSASANEKLKEFVKKNLCRKFYYVLKETINISLEGLKHFFVEVEDKFRKETIAYILEHIGVRFKVLIFVNSRRKCDALYDSLSKKQFSLAKMNLNSTCDERKDVYKKFNDDVYKVLIATDLMVKSIKRTTKDGIVTINYDLPRRRESYLFRSGRWNVRFLRKSIVINFVDKSELENIREIERFYAIKFEELPSNFVKLL